MGKPTTTTSCVYFNKPCVRLNVTLLCHGASLHGHHNISLPVTARFTCALTPHLSSLLPVLVEVAVCWHGDVVCFRAQCVYLRRACMHTSWPFSVASPCIQASTMPSLTSFFTCNRQWPRRCLSVPSTTGIFSIFTASSLPVMAMWCSISSCNDCSGVFCK